MINNSNIKNKIGVYEEQKKMNIGNRRKILK